MTEHEILARELLERRAFAFLPSSARADPDLAVLLEYFAAIKLRPSATSGPTFAELQKLVGILFAWRAARAAAQSDDWADDGDAAA